MTCHSRPVDVVSACMLGGEMPRPWGGQFAFNPLWNHYRCKDDRWIALAMAQADRWWATFVAALGRPELAGPTRSSTR